MAHFVWTNDLNTGEAFIDNDHQRLVSMINAFHDALAEGRANDVINKVINNLITYTKEHFKREEVEMQRINYPQMTTHRQQHDRFVREVEQLKRTADSGGKINAVQVSKFLNDWLRNHILQVDTQLAAALKANK